MIKKKKEKAIDRGYRWPNSANNRSQLLPRDGEELRHREASWSRTSSTKVSPPPPRRQKQGRQAISRKLNTREETRTQESVVNHLLVTRQLATEWMQMKVRCLPATERSRRLNTSVACVTTLVLAIRNRLPEIRELCKPIDYFSD